jgi:hypothetical protein
MERMIRFLGLLLVELVFIYASAPLLAHAAGEIALPRTGQKKCYDSLGAEIVCAGSGQDGDFQKGIAWPAPRFTVNAAGTVTDNLTGLTWLQDANCMKTRYPSVNSSGVVYWSGALDFIDGINQGTYSDCGAGASDWRLPNVNELQSIMHAGYAEELCAGTPCQYLKNWLETQGYLNVQAVDTNSYWTSTTYTETVDNCASCSSAAYWIDLRSGSTGGSSKSGQKRYVFPVRGAISPSIPAKVWATGQTLCFGTDGPIDCATMGKTQDGAIGAGVPWSPPRVTSNADGTASDPLTGLMWLKDANCIKTHYQGVAADGQLTWISALTFVKGINSGAYPLCSAGYADWRMPNIVEFRSLLSYYLKNPALPQGYPFENIEIYSPENLNRAIFWTSNSSTRSPSYAFETNVTDGLFTAIPKSYVRGVWPVRGVSAPGANPPTVTSATISAITQTTATSGGNVSSDGGGGAVTERGVCWGTSANPTTSAINKTTDGNGTGSFSSSITGLSPYTSYHVRAYAVNSAGTSYGEDISFTTNLCPIDVARGGTSYETIQGAVSSGSGAEITAVNRIFVEDLLFSGSSDLTLQGGYACGFGPTTGFSTVHGMITVAGSATVTMGSVAVY